VNARLSYRGIAALVAALAIAAILNDLFQTWVFIQNEVKAELVGVER
jgi:hypothetical protein